MDSALALQLESSRGRGPEQVMAAVHCACREKEPAFSLLQGSLGIPFSSRLSAGSRGLFS